MTENNFEIIIRDDGVYILQTEEYRFHLDEKTHVEKIGKLINENEQLKSDVYDWKASAEDYLKLGKSLKKENEQLYELIDFANTLFAFETSESCQKKWEKRLEEEWEKRLKELNDD